MEEEEEEEEKGGRKDNLFGVPKIHLSLLFNIDTQHQDSGVQIGLKNIGC